MNIITTMEHKSYLRLREVMSILDITLTDAELARKLNLLDQHITHWKKRGVPKDALINLADEWNFRIKYVLYGEGEAFSSQIHYPDSPEGIILKAMKSLGEHEKQQLVNISKTFAAPKEKA